MNPIKILAASFQLLFRNAVSIAVLCLPFLVIELAVKDFISTRSSIRIA